MALAATVVTALVSAQGSGALASDLIPDGIALPAQQDPTPEPTRQFVANPVIQALPTSANVAGATDDDAPNGAGGDTASLAQLVAQQAMPGSLSSDLRCLASAIYFEARGESLDGQLAVGRVVVNRANSGRFPASYCGVVYQPEQFSFVHGRSMPAVREASPDWREAVAIAQIASTGLRKSAATGALYFHAARVSPNWRLTRLARVDNHIFYR